MQDVRTRSATISLIDQRHIISAFLSKVGAGLYSLLAQTDEVVAAGASRSHRNDDDLIRRSVVDDEIVPNIC